MTHLTKKIVSGLLATCMTLTNVQLVQVKAAEATKVEGHDGVELDLTNLSEFKLSDVTLTDEYFVNAMDQDVKYLLSLETDKLLAGFRQTAGVDTKGASRYAGWENSLIGGHTLGHYLTAVAQAYESANTTAEQKTQLMDKLTAIINGLKECQDKVGTGFLFGSTILDKNNIELQFDNVEKNQTNITSQAWVPWYTMHKIIAGIISVAQTDAAIAVTALDVAKSLGTWVYSRVSKWSDATRNTVLNIEYGGMNDCLYELYQLTNDNKFAEAAHKFDQTVLFDKVKSAKAGDNVLNNLHANTTIPKFLGALRRYLCFKDNAEDAIYLEYAKAFWTLVTQNHTYITGGNSEWEHFGEDDVLAGERTNCNCETCNSYNMLKLTKLLYMLTGDVMYADWYENTLLNSIMSSQNPETGMTTYFQPMATGYFKVYGEATTKFWCCTGSGMENFTKLSESFYYYKDDTLIIDQYVSSVLNWSEKGVKLTQTAAMPESDVATFTLEGAFSGKILFRLPDWLAKAATVKVDGKEYNYKVVNNGYALLEGPFASGAKIEITLPMEAVAIGLPDDESMYGFKYGPVVVSALLGSKNMTEASTGVSVTTAGNKAIAKDYTADGSENITVFTDTVDDFIKNINTYLVRDESSDTLKLKLENTDANLTFVTHYKQYKERYGLYWSFTSNKEGANLSKLFEEKVSGRLEEFKLDTVQPGYGQYENDELHNMTEAGEGSVGTTSNGTTRYAKANGSFTYTMLVDEAGTNLLATFDSDDDGKTIKISIGTKTVYEATLNSGDNSSLYQVNIPIEAEVIKDNAKTVTVDGAEKKAVTLTFSGIDNKESARICEFLYTVKSFSTDTSFTKFKVSTGDLYYSKSMDIYLLEFSDDTKEVTVDMDIVSKYGYIKVDDSLVDENSEVKFAVGDGAFTGYNVRVYAEDMTTYKDYGFRIKKGDDTQRSNVDDKVAYFVDCGDHGTDTVSDGDSFGVYNGVTEQIYGFDKVTGSRWGLIDSAEDVYSGSSKSDGLYTANTWCYEFNSLTDGLAKNETNRYTKNQFESGIDRHLDYSFELPDGEYDLEIGYANPWSCSNNQTVYADIDTKNEQLIIDKFQVSETTASGTFTVKNKNVTLNLRSDDLCINVTYIKIMFKGEVSSTSDYVKCDENGLPTDEEKGSDCKKTENSFTLIIVIVAAVVVIVAIVVVLLALKKKKKVGDVQNTGEDSSDLSNLTDSLDTTDSSETSDKKND